MEKWQLLNSLRNSLRNFEKKYNYSKHNIEINTIKLNRRGTRLEIFYVGKKLDGSSFYFLTEINEYKLYNFKTNTTAIEKKQYEDCGVDLYEFND